MTLTNKKGVVAESDKCYPVCIQDQTTPPLIIPMLLPLESTTITAPTVVDSYTCEISSATGISTGDLFRLIDPINNRFYQGTILNLVGTTITTDAPFDFAYPAEGS